MNSCRMGEPGSTSRLGSSSCRCGGLVAERVFVSARIEEEVERAVRLQVRHQVHRDAELLGELGHDDAR